MTAFKCKSCGATIYKETKDAVVCEYCGSNQLLKTKEIKKSIPKTKLKVQYVAVAVVTIIMLLALFIYKYTVPSMSMAHVSKPSGASITFGINIHHGASFPGMKKLLEEAGVSTILIESKLTAKSLKNLDVLSLFGVTKDFDQNEIKLIRDFVNSGGNLIVAAQAWSWTYKAYGNKPIETFPLNKLGKQLGFWITKYNIHAPIHLNEDLKKIIPKIICKNWAPSKISFEGKKYKTFMRDKQYRLIAGSMNYGEGKIILLGHNGIFHENPNLLLYLLKYLYKK